MIGAQYLKPGSFQQHLVSRRHRTNKVKRTIIATIMLTSMIDMFSLLVIFLLQSFSASNEVLTPKQGIVLPPAITGSAPEDAPVLSLAENEVILDSVSFGAPAKLLAQPAPIFAKLGEMKQAWVRSHPGETFRGTVHLEADQAISSVLVSQVVSLLNSQGYSGVHLAVVTGK